MITISPIPYKPPQRPHNQRNLLPLAIDRLHLLFTACVTVGAMMVGAYHLGAPLESVGWCVGVMGAITAFVAIQTEGAKA